MHESVNATVEPTKRMLEHTDGKAVFGEPTKEGTVTVIPVAQASFSSGGGIGLYPSSPPTSPGN